MYLRMPRTRVSCALKRTYRTISIRTIACFSCAADPLSSARHRFGRTSNPAQSDVSTLQELRDVHNV